MTEARLVLEMTSAEPGLSQDETIADMISAAEDMRAGRMLPREILAELADILSDPGRRVTATLRLAVGSGDQEKTETVVLR
jgi:hypothetical protein